jgi:hypothetical protein
MRYTQVFQSFWNDRTSRQLVKCGPAALQTYLYMLTGPLSNYLGAYYWNPAQAALDLNTSHEDVMAYVAQFERLSLVQYDPAAEFIWIVTGAEAIGALKSGDNRVKAAQKEFDAIPADCSFRREFHAKYAADLKLKTLEPTPAAPVSAPAAPADDAQKVMGAAEIVMAQRRYLAACNPDELGRSDDDVLSIVRRLIALAGADKALKEISSAAASRDLDLDSVARCVDALETI